MTTTPPNTSRLTSWRSPAQVERVGPPCESRCCKGTLTPPAPGRPRAGAGLSRSPLTTNRRRSKSWTFSLSR